MTQSPFTRSQRTTIIYGILCVVLVLVVLQLWLLTATMDAFLGGDSSVLMPPFVSADTDASSSSSDSCGHEKLMKAYFMLLSHHLAEVLIAFQPLKDR